MLAKGWSIFTLYAALHELGVQVTRDEAAVFFETTDSEEKGGLNLQEFIQAINYPFKVQQWINTLQLSPLLAHCLTFRGGDSHDPLREISHLRAA